MRVPVRQQEMGMCSNPTCIHYVLRVFFPCPIARALNCPLGEGDIQTAGCGVRCHPDSEDGQGYGPASSSLPGMLAESLHQPL